MTFVMSNFVHGLHLRAIIYPTSTSILPTAREAQEDSGLDLLNSQGIVFYFFKMSYIVFPECRLMFSGM